MGIVYILSGPSCAGKGPLLAAYRKFYTEKADRLDGLVLYNSRSPRPGETDGRDYHFRQQSVIETFRGREGYLVLDVRGDLQALDITELETKIRQGDVFFEGNPHIVKAMKRILDEKKIHSVKIFLSPLSLEEFRYFQSRPNPVDLDELVTDVMRRKLLRRTQKQKGILSQKDLENIERRASSALNEIRMFGLFDYVIANHDGEDSENWDAFYYPLGDARSSLECFAALLDGREHPRAEKWPSDLFSQGRQGGPA